MKEGLRLWLIEKLGGYPDAEAAIEAVGDQATRRKLLTLAVRRLFNTVGPEDILKLHDDKKTWMFQGKPLTETEKEILIAQATQLRESKLWLILKADLLWQANRKTFLLAKDEFDMIAGKVWQYAVDCIDTRLKSMEKKLPLFNVKDK